MSSEDLDGLKPGQFLAKFKASEQPARVVACWEDFEAKQVHGLSENFLFSRHLQ